jgi:hypothetical protein
MLIKKTCAQQLIKKNNPTQLPNKRTAHIDAFHVELLNKTMKDNQHLKQENERLKDEVASLHHKLECYSFIGVTIAFTEERAAMPGKAKDRDFGHCDMNKD